MCRHRGEGMTTEERGGEVDPDRNRGACVVG